MHEIDDKTLVRQAQAGKTDAVAALYDHYHQHIFRYVISRVRHQHLAEDLTGEIFTRMVANLDSYEITGYPFRAWLYRIARNMIVDHFRRQETQQTVPLSDTDNLVDTDAQPAARVDGRLQLERVQAALAHIDPVQREVVVLRFIVGLPLKEVAIAVDKSVAAVKSLQHRGLKALRAALQ